MTFAATTPALLAAIPAPPGANLELGPLTLHAYGLMIGIAVLVGMTLAERLLQGRGIDTSRFYSAVLPAVFMGFVGGRLYHVASEPVRYWNNPGDIVKIWEGGLGIYGAVLLAVATGIALAPRAGLPRGPLVDATAVVLPLSQAIGRIGNWFNQELFGGPTDVPWALEVDPQYRPAEHAAQATFHPTFAYEALGNLVLFALLLWAWHRWRTRAGGVLLALYVAGYSLVRFFVEGLRVDDAHVWMGLRQNEWVALVLMALGLLVAALLQRRHLRRAA